MHNIKSNSLGITTLLLGIVLPVSITISSILLSALIILLIVSSKQRSQIQWLSIVILSLPALIPLFSLVYHGQSLAITQLEVRIPFLATALVFGFFNIDPESLRGIKKGLVFGAILGSVLILFNNYIYHLNPSNSNWLDLSYMPLFMVVGIIILWYTDVDLNRIIKISATAILCGVLLIIGNVFFMLFGFLVTISAIIVKGTRLQSKIGIMILVLTTALVIYKGAEINNYMAHRQASEDSPKNKLAQWQCALEVMTNKEVFGVGYGEKRALLVNCYHDHGMTEAEGSNYNSHNEYLDFFLTFGYIGILAVLIYFINAMFLAYDNKQTALLLIIILLSIFAINENIFTRQKGVMLTSITYLLIYTNAKSKSKSNDDDEKIAVI